MARVLLRSEAVVCLVLLTACGGNPEVSRTGSPGNVESDAGADDAMGGTNGGGSGMFSIPGNDGGDEPDDAAVSCSDADPNCKFVAEGPACGDGVLDDGEECDDGNSTPGDGCDGVCRVEPNASCPPTGGACMSTVECGNGKLEGAETCDDGNTDDGDGCSGDCLVRDPEFDCSTPGELCIDLVDCGDGDVTGSEACDDGGAAGGCLDDCSGVEDGWVCLRPGEACVRVPACGDGILNPGEECDDGDTLDNGCDPDCKLDAGYACPLVGEPCVELVCGDGVLAPGEECDDNDKKAGDGCNASCHVESGWVCPNPGGPCIPKCGDGVLTDFEDCEDGNTKSGDGCSAACLVEPGYFCTNDPCTVGETPTAAVCGNGVPEAGEGCDDGNDLSGDGCTPGCVPEPTFMNGQAVAECGDGAKLASEDCDDGNTKDGDGCSATCKIESGFMCEVQKDDPDFVKLPVVYRDFKDSHPDFEEGPPFILDPGIPGSVCTLTNKDVVCDDMTADCCGRLDQNGRPELDSGEADPKVASATSFGQWYKDVKDVNFHIDDTLTLDRIGPDKYQFSDSSFFPIDGEGFGDQTYSHNYHFTTELRYFFQYEGGELLTFTGDDDVFVFVNGRFALDLGGVHGAQTRTLLLGDEDDSGAIDNGEGSDDTDDRFAITKGELYPIVLFHAERNTTESNFRLTLENFILGRSICSPDCGDGKIVHGEVCDDGSGNNTGDYGACNSTCSGRDFCGDGVVQSGHETCDNGTNLAAYGSMSGCAPGCVPPARCGDGNRDVAFGELCDEGDGNNVGGYGGCKADCTLGPFCGDGDIDTPQEICDDGPANGGYGKACSYTCEPGPFCGDGERNGPEQCDDGADNNTGGYGECRADCTLAPRCGDGVVQKDEGEACDDGVNDGGYGECAPMCQLGPRCGDGVVQHMHEACDDGVNDGGYGECAPACLLGPRCGDGTVQTSAGEQCDDGNVKSGDGCSAGCKSEVRVPR